MNRGAPGVAGEFVILQERRLNRRFQLARRFPLTDFSSVADATRPHPHGGAVG